MKMYKKVLILVFVSLVSLLFANLVKAMTPVLSIYLSGSGDNVTINVTGDANSNVGFYYTSTTYGSQSRVLGMTDANGFLTTTVSSSSYGIAPGTSVYVMVNNTQSLSVVWPYYGNNNLSLSQTNISLALRQTIVVTSPNYNTFNALSVYSNSNTTVASAYQSGSGIAIVGNTVGYTNITICQTGSNNNCSMVYVSVGGGNYNNNNNNYNYYQSGTTFNVSSITLTIGQSTSIFSASQNVGVYAENNPNSDVTSLEYSYDHGGSVLVTAKAVGSNNITMCLSSANSNCSTVYVNVIGR